MLRVGALPVRALPPHYYGFTWNLRGVATEYLEPSVVVRDGEIATRASLDEVATVRLGGLVLEEALTSGGAADLPEHLNGRVRELDYKTLRHPGHWSWVRRIVEELGPEPPGGGAAEDRIAALEERMRQAIPHVEADQVVIYAAAEGEDRDGVRRRIDDHRVVRPRKVGRHTLRAIQLTTAAALAESARMLLLDDPSGVVLQSGIEPERWLAGPFVRRAYSDDGDG
jgi:saccharopine dehydrogenase-like NADP-dependent oxidoreductase